MGFAEWRNSADRLVSSPKCGAEVSRGQKQPVLVPRSVRGNLPVQFSANGITKRIKDVRSTCIGRALKRRKNVLEFCWVEWEGE